MFILLMLYNIPRTLPQANSRWEVKVDYEYVGDGSKVNPLWKC